MSDIKIYRGSGYGISGDWWSPDLKNSEMYKHGPLSGKMSKSKVSLEDYKKGIVEAHNRHKKVDANLMDWYKKNKGKYNSSINTKPRIHKYPSAKQIDIDSKNMSLKDFTAKYYESVLPDQPSKIALGNTLKPLAMNPKGVLGELKPKHAKVLGKAALGQALKLAGPLGVAYGTYDYLRGSPAGEGSDYKPGEKKKSFDGKLKKKKR